MLNRIPPKLRKVLPIIILTILAYIAGGTDWFSVTVHQRVGGTLRAYWEHFVPFIGNIIIGALVVSVLYLLYDPLKGKCHRALDWAGMSERGKTAVMRTVQLVYWGFATIVVITIVAPDFISMVFMGFSLVFAALALALKDVATDFVCGIFGHLNPMIKVGDCVEVTGTQIKGTLHDINYLTTVIKEGDTLHIVPNAKLWGVAIKVIKTPDGGQAACNK